MKKKLIQTVMALTIVVSGSAAYTGSNAEANTDLRDKLKQLEEKQNSNESEKKEAKKEMKQLEKEIKKIHDDMRELDEQITETNDNISDKESEIEDTEERIEELEDRITKLEERIEERDELLKDRVRAMYQNGGSVDYIEVLMGAKSFGDFLDRVSALNIIAEQDRDILEAHIRDQESLEEAKEEVEKERESLEKNLDELEGLQNKLEKKRKKKQDILGDLEEEETVLQDVLLTLEDEKELLKQQEEAAKQELRAYEKRQEELRKEREKKRQSQGSKSETKDFNTNASVPHDNGSTLMKPATGSITSGYGPRWGRMHHGIDIGQGGRSNVPIVAAANGTVVKASYMNGYGNTVMISHNINGQQITTLYAHMSSSSVSAGQRVSKGDQIGIMGNTGASKGPHLHFEVHEGPWNGAKSNSVNPRTYLK
ncbi:murein hydrolase activator EnvC family protein [Alteribacillus iranensis]|uniref:N-terminal domain of peptidoglycan hydrolase CwlO-containing protein n=1 Tax=Alteribacillus iranensis TaxID=930128 RepID=A0A1I2EK91_9BACI|nr:M23 family metallopeptidase [Alteribacillus iranensis]SFE93093.1 N-terminal domain of peptidoglycan hydrolase CwlO-containing protein [Alteribacillus iranensis]